MGLLGVIGGEWVSKTYPDESFIVAATFLIAFFAGMCYKFIIGEYKSYKKMQDGR